MFLSSPCLCSQEGNYLNAVAEVGMFEHSLTTDLLNHLVFVQKVFMKVSAVFSQKLVKLKGECERVLLQYSIALFHFQPYISVTFCQLIFF